MVFYPIEIILQSLWLMLPAYLPNSAAAFFGRGKPLDFGKNFPDGRRILGDGKTWRGTFGGVFSGMVLGGILMLIIYPFDQDLFPTFGDSTFEVFVVLFSLSFGAILGDCLGSFAKRRFNVKRGAKAPGLDQYDFLIGSFLMIFIFARDWGFDRFDWGHILVILIATPLLHRAVNIIGYKKGYKDVPW